MQGHSHQYGWSSFNQTTFQGNNHISANIHKFGSAPGRLVGSHVATVDSARDRWLPDEPHHPTKVPRTHILISEK